MSTLFTAATVAKVGAYDPSLPSLHLTPPPPSPPCMLTSRMHAEQRPLRVNTKTPLLHTQDSLRRSGVFFFLTISEARCRPVAGKDAELRDRSAPDVCPIATLRVLYLERRAGDAASCACGVLAHNDLAVEDEPVESRGAGNALGQP